MRGEVYGVYLGIRCVDADGIKERSVPKARIIRACRVP